MGKPEEHTITIERIPRAAAVEFCEGRELPLARVGPHPDLQARTYTATFHPGPNRLKRWGGSYSLRLRRHGRTIASRWGVMPGDTWRVPRWVAAVAWCAELLPWVVDGAGSLEGFVDVTGTPDLDPEAPADWELTCNGETVAELLHLTPATAEEAALREVGRSELEGEWLLFLTNPTARPTPGFALEEAG